MGEPARQRSSAGDARTEAAIRVAAASGARTVTSRRAVIARVAEMTVREYERCPREDWPRERLLGWAREFAVQQARTLVAREDDDQTRWPDRIAPEDFAGYLRGDDAAFGRILAGALWEFSLAHLRRAWPAVPYAVVEDWAATACSWMWSWWRSRPASRPATPAALVGYVSKVLDNVPRYAHRRRAKREEPERHSALMEQHVPPAPQADGAAAARWLPNLLELWATQPPARCASLLRPLLPGVAAMMRRSGQLPGAELLSAEFGLSMRTARRRHAELCALVAWAAEEEEL